jgi:hypothetical protein
VSAATGTTRGLAALFLAISILAPPSRSNATPTGYFVDSTQAVAERPAEVVTEDGDFTITIHRNYKDALGQRLLGIAEATYPPREAILDRAITRGTEIGSDSARTLLWWSDGLGVSRVPYAITAGTIDFYRKLTAQFRRHNFWGAWDHNLYWTDLDYKATIEHRAEYIFEGQTMTDVYVAEMNLEWSFDDGVFVPASVAYRIVVLSPDGKVLAVGGDGETREQVFFSAHRAPGQRDLIFR